LEWYNLFEANVAFLHAPTLQHFDEKKPGVPMLEGLFKKTKIPLLEVGLRSLSVRQKAIAQNMANVATPGYRRLTVPFEEQLKLASQNHVMAPSAMTHPRHIPIRPDNLEKFFPIIERSNDPEPFSGVNNVDIDEEMGALVKNQISFEVCAQVISGSFRSLKRVMSENRG
jgi:flagellar basal-body rod protein FlgB